MITRIWRGRTDLEHAEAYEAFLQKTAYPDYGGVEGNKGWLLLRQQHTDCVEFMFVSFWDSMEAVQRYAGDTPERPKYYAEDRAMLLELPELVEHFELIDKQLA